MHFKHTNIKITTSLIHSFRRRPTQRGPTVAYVARPNGGVPPVGQPMNATGGWQVVSDTTHRGIMVGYRRWHDGGDLAVDPRWNSTLHGGGTDGGTTVGHPWAAVHTAVGATSAPMAAKNFLPSGRRWHTAVGASRLAAVGVGNVCWVLLPWIITVNKGYILRTIQCNSHNRSKYLISR